MIDIDFKRFNEAGLKPVIKKFEQAKLPVKEVVGTNKPKRESGFLTKMVTFVFDSGQKLVVKAKAGGSIYQAKLNGRVLPIKHVDDIDKAVKEVVTHVKHNEKAYLKRKANQLKKQKIKIPKLKPVNTSVKAQIEALSTTKTQLTQAHDEARVQIQETTTANQEKQATLDGLVQEFNDLTALRDRLTGELADLQEAA